jgi:hypothetical protein
MYDDQWRLVAVGKISRSSRIPHETRSEPRFLAAALASTLLCLQVSPAHRDRPWSPTLTEFWMSLDHMNLIPATVLHAIRPLDGARLSHCVPAQRIARCIPLGMKWLDLHLEAHDDRLPK